MDILFIHSAFLGHFEPITRYLASSNRHRVHFMCLGNGPSIEGVERIEFSAAEPSPPSTLLTARPFERTLGLAHGVYDALKNIQFKPDLIVSYAGFGCSIFARHVFPDVPIVGYFPYYYHAKNSELDFIPYAQPQEIDRLAATTRNAGMLLEHANITGGYTPTNFQASRFPSQIRSGLRVLHDGIDCDFWSRRSVGRLEIGSFDVPRDIPLITYVARGLELYRGSDRALRVIELILKERRDAHAVIVGKPQPYYGMDLSHTGGLTLKEICMQNIGSEQSSRMHFVDWITPDLLADLYSRSDLNLYFTVPYTLSWSMLNAMSVGTPMLISNTEPTREFVESGKNGLLIDFFDTDEWVARSLDILSAPHNYHDLWHHGRSTLRERCDIRTALPTLEAYLLSFLAQ